MTSMVALPRPLAATVLWLALVAAACGGSAAVTTAPAPASAAPPSVAEPPSVTEPPSVAEPTPVPGPTGDPGAGQGGGSSGSSGGSGGSVPANPGGPAPATLGPGTGGGGGVAPPDPQPTIVTPTTGLTGVHPVQATKLEAAVNGRDVAVRVAWWSGVEPCNALAGITVARDGDTFLLTVNEGSAARPDTVCIEIAKYKAAVVDLGELEPGTYTIKAFGEPAPIEVTVAG